MHGVAYLPKNGNYLIALLPGFAYLEELGMSGLLMVRLFIGVDKSKDTVHKPGSYDDTLGTYDSTTTSAGKHNTYNYNKLKVSKDI